VSGCVSRMQFSWIAKRMKRGEGEECVVHCEGGCERRGKGAGGGGEEGQTALKTACLFGAG
jgi:hypothetical protein